MNGKDDEIVLALGDSALIAMWDGMDQKRCERGTEHFEES